MLKFLKALAVTGMILLCIGILGIVGLILGLILRFCGWILFILAFIGFIFLMVYVSIGDDKKND